MMKKIILLIIVFFNLIPVVKNKQLSLCSLNTVMATCNVGGEMANGGGGDSWDGTGDGGGLYDNDYPFPLQGNMEIHDAANSLQTVLNNFSSNNWVVTVAPNGSSLMVVYTPLNQPSQIVFTGTADQAAATYGFMANLGTANPLDDKTDECGNYVEPNWLYVPDPEWTDPFDPGDGAGGGNNEDPPKDCAGVVGGTAVNKPDCGCVGGTTGLALDQCPCPPAAAAAGITASSNYTSAIKSTAANFTPFDPNVTNQSEEAFAINKFTGNCTATSIISVATTGGGISSIIGPFVEFLVHTHPYGGLQTPSAKDFFQLANYRATSLNFTTSYIIAFDGSKYAMTIDDVTKLNNFIANNPNSITASGEFDLSKAVGISWQSIGADLIGSGFTGLEAEERALARIMSEAGVILLKAEKDSDIFNKIDAEKKKNADGTLAKDSSGYQLYVKSDCK